jgi:hypothetical protein
VRRFVVVPFAALLRGVRERRGRLKPAARGSARDIARQSRLTAALSDPGCYLGRWHPICFTK